jgi:hypothetical protein
MSPWSSFSIWATLATVEVHKSWRKWASIGAALWSAASAHIVTVSTSEIKFPSLHSSPFWSSQLRRPQCSEVIKVSAIPKSKVAIFEVLKFSIRVLCSNLNASRIIGEVGSSLFSVDANPWL